MSSFEVTKNFPRISRENISVKCIDQKWKNFPKAILPRMCADKLDFYKNFCIRPNDIFILGYPRSGTSRLQELVWIIANDFDFKTLVEYDADARCINFEIRDWSLKWREKTLISSLEDMPSPRLMKSHLPAQLLPNEVWTKKPKLFYISREVKDVAISQFHLLSCSYSNSINFDDYLEDFLNDNVMFSPYRENLWNYLNLPDYENILYLTYEEMSADLDLAIDKVAEFLEKSVSDENAEKIKDYLKFENMKARKTNDNKQTYNILLKHLNSNNHKDYNFIRKGVVGGYKNEMSSVYIDKFDEWFAKSKSLNQGFNYTEKF
ncbi:hypothetical protein ACKWTF_011362 [Chironomus riparius]